MIAAMVAAVATVMTLFFTVLNKRGEEFRTAHRDVIADDLKRVERQFTRSSPSPISNSNA